MTTAQILLALAVGLTVSEFSEVCPWAARKLIRWSAHRRYAPPSRAEIRAEELAAYLDDRPGRLLKLITALGFAAAAIVTRKTAPAVAPPEALWQPSKLGLIFESENDTVFRLDPNTRAMRKSWYQLTTDIRNAAKEVGVSSRSWRRCIKKLQRITRDDRWMLISRNLHDLEYFRKSLPRKTTTVTVPWAAGTRSYTYKITSWYAPTDLTVTHYQAAVETTRAEIRRLTSDFLNISSAPH